MENIVNKSFLRKLLLIFGLMMPFLIILEVLPTEKVIICFVLSFIGGTIYCWGFKGGVGSAVYSSLIILSMHYYAPWTASGLPPALEISLYLCTGIGGGLLATFHQNRYGSPAHARENEYTPGEIRQFPDLLKEVEQAKIELDMARQNFEYAEDDLIESASLELKDSLEKYDRLMKLLKKSWQRHMLTVKINTFPRS